jgi:hypothetical protein
VASLSKKTKAKRNRRLYRAGRRRKNVEARASTLSSEELFAACGEPGKPVA